MVSSVLPFKRGKLRGMSFYASHVSLSPCGPLLWRAMGSSRLILTFTDYFLNGMLHSSTIYGDTLVYMPISRHGLYECLSLTTLPWEMSREHALFVDWVRGTCAMVVYPLARVVPSSLVHALLASLSTGVCMLTRWEALAWWLCTCLLVGACLSGEPLCWSMLASWSMSFVMRVGLGLWVSLFFLG